MVVAAGDEQAAKGREASPLGARFLRSCVAHLGGRGDDIVKEAKWRLLQQVIRQLRLLHNAAQRLLRRPNPRGGLLSHHQRLLRHVTARNGRFEQPTP